MAAFLGMFQNFLGPVFVAIASGPAFQLSWGPAAELEKLLPMLFHEVENSGDGRFLFFLRFSEGLPADVDVKAAGLGLVGTVAQRAGCAQDFRPGISSWWYSRLMGCVTNSKPLLREPSCLQ